MKKIAYVIFVWIVISCANQEKQHVHGTIKGNNTKNEDFLMFNDTQMKLANIRTQVVKEQSVGESIPINARMVTDQELTEVISTRSAGRINKLYVKETGKVVRKGEILYDLYSENLLTLQKEYLLTKEQFEKLGRQESRYLSFVKSAEKKLLLYGLTQSQINDLASSKKIQNHVAFLSPTSGIVKEINIEEGQYVTEGELLYQIENINQLWVEGELYPEETSLVKKGDRIKVQINGSPVSEVEGIVKFLNPEYRANTQIVIMRATISNESLTWKPGMLATVLLQHSLKKGLTLPVDAVIRDERGAHVYVQIDNNTFSPRMVKTGLENSDTVEITDGLQSGETVAISGAYLLYSELILKKGVDPMTAHRHTINN